MLKTPAHSLLRNQASKDDKDARRWRVGVYDVSAADLRDVQVCACCVPACLHVRVCVCELLLLPLSINLSATAGSTIATIYTAL